LSPAIRVVTEQLILARSRVGAILWVVVDATAGGTDGLDGIIPIIERRLTLASVRLALALLTACHMCIVARIVWVASESGHDADP
jgi:hypothetical protein